MLSYRYRCRVVDVHDGDTVKVLIDCGFRVSTTVWIRLKDVYAPELSTLEGVGARDYLREILSISDNLIVETEINRNGNEVMSFTRYIGALYFEENLRTSINQHLAEVFPKAGVGVKGGAA